MTAAAPPRLALVTGAARGIGRRIAEVLRAEGMELVVLDVDSAVCRVAEALDARPAVVDLVADDASDAVRAALGDDVVWLLVNNAGTFDKSPLLDVDLRTWDRVQAVNARSMVVTMQAAVPAMVERGSGGRVVNMASMAAKLGTPGEAAYAASKAAVVALSRIAAMELGCHGITVNALCPGYVLTEMGAEGRSEGDVAAWEAMSPLGRLAHADDVAAAVSHLGSDRAGYITGQALNVSGGMCTW